MNLFEKKTYSQKWQECKFRQNLRFSFFLHQYHLAISQRGQESRFFVKENLRRCVVLFLPKKMFFRFFASNNHYKTHFFIFYENKQINQPLFWKKKCTNKIQLNLIFLEFVVLNFSKNTLISKSSYFSPKSSYLWSLNTTKILFSTVFLFSSVFWVKTHTLVDPWVLGILTNTWSPPNKSAIFWCPKHSGFQFAKRLFWGLLYPQPLTPDTPPIWTNLHREVRC